MVIASLASKPRLSDNIRSAWLRMDGRRNGRTDSQWVGRWVPGPNFSKKNSSRTPIEPHNRSETENSIEYILEFESISMENKHFAFKIYSFKNFGHLWLFTFFWVNHNVSWWFVKMKSPKIACRHQKLCSLIFFQCYWLCLLLKWKRMKR